MQSLLFYVLFVVAARSTKATERFDRLQWPLTASSLVVTGPLGGGGLEVGRTRGQTEVPYVP